MNDNEISKDALWTDKIHSFRQSGLSRKEWCQQNGIAQSTLSYWIRKNSLSETDTAPEENISAPVFEKLPSEQEIHQRGDSAVPLMVIRLEENIRIEIAADCPACLMASLLQAIKSYA